MVVIDVNEKNIGSNLKFLCSYGGKIIPRFTDGKLRYVGGITRVLSVNHSISFQELMKKICEFSGYYVDLRCQLPNGDLETLISVKSEEDLANIVEEYNRVSREVKIRAILSSPRSPSSSSSSDRSPKSPLSNTLSPPNYGIYCLPPTDLPRRINCYACRVHKDSRLIWH